MKFPFHARFSLPPWLVLLAACYKKSDFSPTESVGQPGHHLELAERRDEPAGRRLFPVSIWKPACRATLHSPNRTVVFLDDPSEPWTAAPPAPTATNLCRKRGGRTASRKSPGST